MFYYQNAFMNMRAEKIVNGLPQFKAYCENNNIFLKPLKRGCCFCSGSDQYLAAGSIPARILFRD